MSNTSINIDPILSKNEHVGALKLERNLQDIIERAHSFTDFEKIAMILCFWFIATCIGIALWEVSFQLKRKGLISDILSRRETNR